MRDLKTSVVIPDQVGRSRCQPTPAEYLLLGDIATREDSDRAPQQGNCGGASLGEDQRQAFQEQIARKRRIRWIRRSRHGARDIQQAAALTRQSAGEERCGPRVEVRVARQAYVERLELSSSLEQQHRSFAAAVLGKRDLGLQPIHARSTEVVESSGLSCRHQLERRIERARFEARLGRGQARGLPVARAPG